ncbi:MAG TPA: TetR/AcrR family transcriptional regulator [Pseudonocardiaceae bacterium]|nr:TetR/AcrR family transcriptional regulator [Pseudonocardiaceae bacterium]
MRSKADGNTRTFADQARRAQIVACAIEVIAELGYPQASIRKIAERVGVAMSVVLYHFDNKDELVAAIATELYRALIAVMGPWMAAESTATGKLRAYIRGNALFIHSHRPEYAVLLDIGLTFRSRTGKRLYELDIAPELQGDLAKLDLESILRLGQETGEFRPMHPKSMALAVRGALNGAVLQVVMEPGFDVLAYGEELVTTFHQATRRTR